VESPCWILASTSEGCRLTTEEGIRRIAVDGMIDPGI